MEQIKTTGSSSRNTHKRSFTARLVPFVAAAAISVSGCCLGHAFGQAATPAPLASAGNHRPASTRPATPYTSKHIYSDTADPRADIVAALKQAKHDHKRVLLDFGGDWCGDCQVLDIYFHQDPNTALLDKHFILVHVWIGREDHNLDIAEKYKVPLDKGVPALAVLSGTGRILYSQQTGEFEDMRHMDASSVTEFLNHWKS